jgi:hypothetical protein
MTQDILSAELAIIAAWSKLARLARAYDDRARYHFACAMVRHHLRNMVSHC